MIVLDASAAAEMVLNTSNGHKVRSMVADPAVSIHSPQLMIVEAIQVLRRFWRPG